MAERFDAYHQWLGISPKDQPPHHYRLLGIDLFESSSDVIEHAADRQMAHIRSLQTGKNADAAQEILTQISAAKICLLNPSKKAAYDEQLRALQSEKKLPSARLLTAKPLDPAPASSASVTAGKRETSSTLALLLALVVGGVALLLLAGGGLAAIFWLSASPRQVLQIVDVPTESMVVAPVDDEATTIAPVEPPVVPVSDDGSDVEGSPGEGAAPPQEPSDGEGPPDSTTESPISGDESGEPADEPEGEDDPATVDAASDPPATSPEETQAARLAVPDKSTREAKRREIENVFRVSEAKTADAKTELAQRLLETAGESADDAAAQFALYNAAREVALQTGDVRLAFDAVDALEIRFEIDATAVKIASLESASKAASSPESKAAVIALGVSLVDEFVAQDEYEKAGTLITSLQALARRVRDRQGTALLTERRKLASEWQQQFEQAQAALEKLKETPDDPAANLAAGRYFAFAKGDQPRGFALLAKGDDEVLQKIAQGELASPTAAAEQAQLADAWWDAAAKQEKDVARICLARAALWYGKAEPNLTGLAAVKAASRVKEVQQQGIDVEQVASAGTLAMPAPIADSSSPNTSGRPKPKPKPSPIQPGLVTRVYHGQPFGTPTNLLAVTTSSDDFAKLAEQAQPLMRAVLGQAHPEYVSQGFIYLDKQAEVSLTFFNANCKVNGVEICNSNGDTSLTQLMPAGLHTIAIHRQDHGRGGPNFKVTLAETGANALFHRRDQLQIELARPVAIGGRLLAGQLLGDAAIGGTASAPTTPDVPESSEPPLAESDEPVEDRRGIEWVGVPQDGKLSRCATIAEFPHDADDRVVLAFLAKAKKGDELGGRKLVRELAEEDGKFRGPLTMKTKKYYMFRVRTEKQQASVLKSETFTMWGHSTVEVFVNFQVASTHGQVPLARGENIIVVKQNHDHSDHEDRSWIKLSVTGDKLLQGY